MCTFLMIKLINKIIHRYIIFVEIYLIVILYDIPQGYNDLFLTPNFKLFNFKCKFLFCYQTFCRFIVFFLTILDLFFIKNISINRTLLNVNFNKFLNIV